MWHVVQTADTTLWWCAQLVSRLCVIRYLTFSHVLDVRGQVLAESSDLQESQSCFLPSASPSPHMLFLEDSLHWPVFFFWRMTPPRHLLLQEKLLLDKIVHYTSNPQTCHQFILQPWRPSYLQYRAYASYFTWTANTWAAVWKPGLLLRKIYSREQGADNLLTVDDIELHVAEARASSMCIC